MLPGKSGLALAKELRGDARTRELPIIMLTARTDEADKVAGLEAWVDDYVTKPFSPRELKARIKAVLRRRAPEAAQEPLVAGALRLDPATHRVTADGNAVPLGPTEFRLLRFLLARPERVHSRTQLLDQVWGDTSVEGTVDVIRRRRAAQAVRAGCDRDGPQRLPARAPGGLTRSGRCDRPFVVAVSIVPFSPGRARRGWFGAAWGFAVLAVGLARSWRLWHVTDSCARRTGARGPDARGAWGPAFAEPARAASAGTSPTIGGSVVRSALPDGIDHRRGQFNGQTRAQAHLGLDL
jgi:hypothetical protein